MTAAVVIAGTVVLSVAIVVCSVILLVSDPLLKLRFSTEGFYFQGFCLWPSIQELRKNKRLKAKQNEQAQSSTFDNVYHEYN